MDSRARRMILARRQRLIAAAIGIVGGTACTPQSAPHAAAPTPSASAASAPGSTPYARPAGSGSSTSELGSEPVTPSPMPSTTPPIGDDKLDSDGDGVPDARDRCPEVAGVDAPDSLQAGCPPRPCLTVLPADEIEFRARIQFAHGQSTLPAASGAVLDEIARVLADHDEIQLEIIGHTDSTEPEDLALLRARRVRDAIVTRGIAPSRLELTAQGARSPAAPNTTAEGRAQNRRVEFMRRGPRAPLGR